MLGDDGFTRTAGALRMAPALDVKRASRVGQPVADEVARRLEIAIPAVAVSDLALLAGDTLVALGRRCLALGQSLHRRFTAAAALCARSRSSSIDGIGRIRHASTGDENVCAGTTLVDKRIQSTPAHGHAS